jgi:hypothetical protein
MIVDSNIGGRKDDFWLQRSFDLGIQVQADGSVDHTLRLRYYGLTRHAGLAAPYRDWLRVYLPAGASNISWQGAQFAIASGEGRTIVQGWLTVGYGETAVVSLSYRFPAERLGPGHYRVNLLWQKQAGRQADTITIRIQAPVGWQLTDPRKHLKLESSIASTLSTDRELVFDARSAE